MSKILLQAIEPRKHFSSGENRHLEDESAAYTWVCSGIWYVSRHERCRMDLWDTIALLEQQQMRLLRTWEVALMSYLVNESYPLWWSAELPLTSPLTEFSSTDNAGHSLVQQCISLDWSALILKWIPSVRTIQGETDATVTWRQFSSSM